VGLIAQSVAVTIGVLLGLLAGFYGRWIDAPTAQAPGGVDRRVLLQHGVPWCRMDATSSG